MAINHVVSTSLKYQTQLVENVKGQKEIGIDPQYYAPTVDMIKKISEYTSRIVRLQSEMTEARKEANLTQEQLFTWLDAILPVDFINSRLDDYMAKKLEKDELEAFQLPNRLVTEEVDPTKLPNSPGGQIGE
jgi:hypothetical protein